MKIYTKYIKNTALIVFCSLIAAIFILEGCRMKKIDLPEPKLKGNLSLEEAIYLRRSVRSFGNKPLELDMISQLLWASQGITDKEKGFRAVPSAGALYPLEVYVSTKNGFFHYLVNTHQLDCVNKQDLRKKISEASWGQSFIHEAPVVFIITAVYERVTSRYSKRGERYVDFEVGHAAQNLELEAVSLGLGSVSVGAFDDTRLKSVLNLPENEKVLYIIPVGYPK